MRRRPKGTVLILVVFGLLLLLVMAVNGMNMFQNQTITSLDVLAMSQAHAAANAITDYLVMRLGSAGAGGWDDWGALPGSGSAAMQGSFANTTYTLTYDATTLTSRHIDWTLTIDLVGLQQTAVDGGGLNTVIRKRYNFTTWKQPKAMRFAVFRAGNSDYTNPATQTAGELQFDGMTGFGAAFGDVYNEGNVYYLNGATIDGRTFMPDFSTHNISDPPPFPHSYAFRGTTPNDLPDLDMSRYEMDYLTPAGELDPLIYAERLAIQASCPNSVCDINQTYTIGDDAGEVNLVLNGSYLSPSKDGKAGTEDCACTTSVLGGTTITGHGNIISPMTLSVVGPITVTPDTIDDIGFGAGSRLALTGIGGSVFNYELNPGGTPRRVVFFAHDYAYVLFGTTLENPPPRSTVDGGGSLWSVAADGTVWITSHDIRFQEMAFEDTTRRPKTFVYSYKNLVTASVAGWMEHDFGYCDDGDTVGCVLDLSPGTISWYIGSWVSDDALHINAGIGGTSYLGLYYGGGENEDGGVSATTAPWRAGPVRSRINDGGMGMGAGIRGTLIVNNLERIDLGSNPQQTIQGTVEYSQYELPGVRTGDEEPDYFDLNPPHSRVWIKPNSWRQ